jgi:hypothetical protein
MARLPAQGAAVSVLEFGTWLDGVVAETSEASAEFLVEFDDEDEVSAWVSVGQPWRSLGPLMADAVSMQDDQPALPAPCVESAAEAASVPADAKMEPSQQEHAAAPEHEPTEDVPAANGEGEGDEAECRDVIVEQFARLHAATERSDGHGTETAVATHRRFEQLLHAL